ncbi:MAG: hypothetical protein LKE33_12920 [Acidaminococcus sp.]|jgi:hypothetical protein|nr:hypothetical protein [Acidaminococcus sp.]MCI2100705.1 hypothetical protein [Acidaminococcus sp.]MCI2115026.1 hypothetical protein [Acidaminococcus sp.]MCI2117101.1 hypothetical protein [Acidaminococcus sp.]
MKKIMCFIGALAVCLGFFISGTPKAAYAMRNLPASQLPYSDMLYGKYPLVGANDASTFYLDTTSCYAASDGNIATLSALVYSPYGGAQSDGSPAHLSKITFVFKTYKRRFFTFFSGVYLLRLELRGSELT